MSNNKLMRCSRCGMEIVREHELDEIFNYAYICNHLGMSAGLIVRVSKDMKHTFNVSKFIVDKQSSLCPFEHRYR